MVRWTRSAQIAHEKVPQAMKWAKETAEFANKKYKTQITVYMDFFGEVGTIRWFNDYTDLAAFEKVRSQLLADQEYFQRLTQAADLLVQGSGFDTVMHTI